MEFNDKEISALVERAQEARVRLNRLQQQITPELPEKKRLKINEEIFQLMGLITEIEKLANKDKPKFFPGRIKR